MNNERGFLLYANHSDKINYPRLAICCALAIKTNLINNNVTVLMDKDSIKNMKDIHSEDVINSAFDRIIVTEKQHQPPIREHSNSPWYKFKCKFNNKHRIHAYTQSPYEETILMDVDYIVMNDELDNVWGCNEDLLMNRKAIDLQGNDFGSIDEKRLEINGIPMYWATLVYFKKSDFSKTFFDLVNYIKEEYSYFRFLYGFGGSYYRNDFSFSIAAHIINGFEYGGQKSFPSDTIVTSYQEDEIADFKDSKELILISTNMDEKWKSVLVNSDNTSIHFMNKVELFRISEDFIKSCMEKL
jgi:hypothetical protein